MQPPEAPPDEPKFLVLATFRDADQKQVKPFGLEWGMAAQSQVVYVKSPPDLVDDRNPQKAFPADVDTESLEVRREIVAAHNLWSFAKGLRFVTVDDMREVTVDASGRVFVLWRPRLDRETQSRPPDVAGAIRDDPSAKEPGHPVEVWINGRFAAILDGPSTVERVLAAVAQCRSVKLELLRSDGLLRVERYFRGRPRGEELFEHIMDNLYGIEDPTIVDDRTIIGTATLPDWIMGGQLTSRIWVRENDDGTVTALRPLYDDSIETTDRRYTLLPGTVADDRRLAVLRRAVSHVRYLSTFAPPVRKT